MTKIDARVPMTLKVKIEEQAGSEQLSSSEWIRETLAAVIEADRNDTRKWNEAADQLATLIEGRFDRLEQRIFDENSVILKIGFEILLDLAQTNAAAQAAALAAEDLPSDEVEEIRSALIREGDVYYNRRKDEIFPVLNQMRIEARAKARAAVTPQDGRDGSS